jgi:hypothetical protein
MILTDWSRDGRHLTFWSGQGMFVLALAGDRTPITVEQGRGGRFSPDGRFFAYNAGVAGQAGRFHVVVRPFDGSTIVAAPGTAPRQVSVANAIGGISWRRDGGEMYFLSQEYPQTVMAADVSGSTTLDVNAPRMLFQLPPGIGAPAQLSNVSSPDGQRFVFAVNLPPRQPAQ